MIGVPQATFPKFLDSWRSGLPSGAALVVILIIAAGALVLFGALLLLLFMAVLVLLSLTLLLLFPFLLLVALGLLPSNILFEEAHSLLFSGNLRQISTC